MESALGLIWISVPLLSVTTMRSSDVSNRRRLIELASAFDRALGLLPVVERFLLVAIGFSFLCVCQHFTDLFRQLGLGAWLEEKLRAVLVGVLLQQRVVGGTGYEQHLDLRSQPPRLLGQRRSVQAARHADVGEQEVDVGAARQRFQRLGA